MINLLPQQERENILYARRNTHLVRWTVALVLAIIGGGAIVFAGQVIIDHSTAQVTEQVQAGVRRLADQKQNETQARIQEISGSLKLAADVLSRQIVLSELIPQIGAVLPAGTSLAGLQLNQVKGGLDLSVAATDYQTATQVQVNLQDPDNKLFQKADINSITCTGSDDPRYPCLASFRALFAADNPFTLINEAEQKDE